MRGAEILAPAGGPESLKAAVRCGADAVYLGGRALNARRGAENFDGNGLPEAVRYCHARGVKVYLTLNTIIFEEELEVAEGMIRSVCEAGIDALIVQDLAIAALARECAPSMPLHASTQMAVHNAEGASMLEKLGFSRVVLARELSMDEISEIGQKTCLPLECFVHGALCMCVSGQCYLSAMIGGRSGNRGFCAQPCRLPMYRAGNGHCLSLKDLSLIERVPEMLAAGVSSFKIEGRMKRAEYVAAAVMAVRRKLAGEDPDLGALRSVFSRDGFTSGYFDGLLGADMFGRRSRADVVAASPVLFNKLAAEYREERPLIPVDFSLTLKAGEPASLTASDESGRSVAVTGDIPLNAVTAPTTSAKAAAALSKTGGTPFYAANISAETGEGLMLPASSLNALRRAALDALLSRRESPEPRAFTEKPDILRFSQHSPGTHSLRARIACAEQLCGELVEACGLVIVPACELSRLDPGLLDKYADRIATELPRMVFGAEESEKLSAALKEARRNGVSRAVAGNLGGIKLALGLGFETHGDWPLNISNSLSLSEYERLGLCSATLSAELTKGRIAKLGGELPRGIIAYGYLPLMLMRNSPGGLGVTGSEGFVTDRLGNRFPIRSVTGAYELLNCVPLFLADRLGEFGRVDFFTMYFTVETPEECIDILHLCQTGGKTDAPKTRGLYFRGVE